MTKTAELRRHGIMIEYSIDYYCYKHNLTIVGTMRKCKREIPECMKASKSRETKTSNFAFNYQITMVSYVPKKNKSVIMLSTMHHDINIKRTQKGQRLSSFTIRRRSVLTWLIKWFKHILVGDKLADGLSTSSATCWTLHR